MFFSPSIHPKSEFTNHLYYIVFLKDVKQDYE